MNEPSPEPRKRRHWPPRFSDFQPRETFETYARTVTEADLQTFLGLSGIKFPVFLDENFARDQTPFGGRIVPGFLTASITAGMMENVLGPDVLAGLGLDAFRFHAPVRPGDTIRSEITVNDTRETSDGERGIVSLDVKVINQKSETVLDYRATVLMLNRRD